MYFFTFVVLMDSLYGRRVLRRVPDEDVGDSGRGISPGRRVDSDGVRNANDQRARQASNERVHGLVTRSAPSHGTGQPQDAQLRDLKATWR